MTFEEFMNQAWDDHGAQARAVATRLADGLPLATSSAHLLQLAVLTTHVYGEHLGDWSGGLSALRSLRASSLVDSEVDAGLKRSTAVLELGGRTRETLDEFSKSDQTRVLATAAAAVIGQNETARGEKLLKDALKLAEDLPREDAANRALAVTANNLAGALEEKRRSPEETNMMIEAAHVARKFWDIAGGWMQVERAEYRLAKSYLAAGDRKTAHNHARECLRICEANQADEAELKYAREIVEETR